MSFLSRARTGSVDRSDLLARILVAIPAGAVAVVLILAGGPYFAVGIGLLAAACLHELYEMYAVANPSRLAGLLGLIGITCAAGFGDEQTVLMAFMATLPVIFCAVALQPGAGGAPAVSVTLLGLAWIGLALAHAILVRGLDHGTTLVIAIALGTFLGDTGAYLGGRAFGHTKLAASISPNKTVEGLLIGMATCVLVVWYVALSADGISGSQGALLGLAVAIAAPIGDLFESFFKRDAGVKDSGRMFGPHGGALDRVDAVMFAAVAGYYTWVLLLV